MDSSHPLDIGVFALWLATGDRGLSSEAIVNRATGINLGRYGGRIIDHPHDVGDLLRCEMMLRAVPLARMTLPLMSNVSPAWAALVPAWDELVALCESEIPGLFDGAGTHGSAPLAYARIREVLTEVWAANQAAAR